MLLYGILARCSMEWYSGGEIWELHIYMSDSYALRVVVCLGPCARGGTLTARVHTLNP